jgi:ADP-heptose:LPS heptosyltransferase
VHRRAAGNLLEHRFFRNNISLQKDLRSGDEELLRQHPQVIHVGDRLADFGETAAIMSLLGLVISSDTAPVHLAGALGRPVWILLRHVPVTSSVAIFTQSASISKPT